MRAVPVGRGDGYDGRACRVERNCARCAERSRISGIAQAQRRVVAGPVLDHPAVQRQRRAVGIVEPVRVVALQHLVQKDERLAAAARVVRGVADAVGPRAQPEQRLAGRVVDRDSLAEHHPQLDPGAGAVRVARRVGSHAQYARRDAVDRDGRQGLRGLRPSLAGGHLQVGRGISPSHHRSARCQGRGPRILYAADSAVALQHRVVEDELVRGVALHVLRRRAAVVQRKREEWGLSLYPDGPVKRHRDIDRAPGAARVTCDGRRHAGHERRRYSDHRDAVLIGCREGVHGGAKLERGYTSHIRQPIEPAAIGSRTNPLKCAVFVNIYQLDRTLTPTRHYGMRGGAKLERVEFMRYAYFKGADGLLARDWSDGVGVGSPADPLEGAIFVDADQLDGLFGTAGSRNGVRLVVHYERIHCAHVVQFGKWPDGPRARDGARGVVVGSPADPLEGAILVDEDQLDGAAVSGARCNDGVRLVAKIEHVNVLRPAEPLKIIISVGGRVGMRKSPACIDME